MMKILNKFILLGIVAAISFSCEPDGPFDIHDNPANLAPFVSIDVQSDDLIDFTNPSDTYSFTLMAPGNNIASYNLRVASSSQEDTVDLLTINEFPQEVTVTFEQIASAFSASTADFSPGDEITFLGVVTDTDGDVGVFDDLNGDARGEGIMQALRHRAFIFCPFNSDEVGGMYEVTSLGFGEFFGETNLVREVVAGPDENQITIIGGAYPTVGGTDLIVDVDPANGVASLGGDGTAFSADAGAFDTDSYGTVSGFVFSCVGSISLTLDFDTYAGNAHAVVLQKQ